MTINAYKDWNYEDYIGMTYLDRNKRETTIEDVHTTTNTKGETVKKRFVTSHHLLGQKIFSYDVVKATVDMALMKQTTKEVKTCQMRVN